MAEYITNFTAGFEDAAAKRILYELGGAVILHVESGQIRFRYAGKPEFVARLPFVNNSFAVISQYKGAGLTFEQMARGAARKTFKPTGAGANPKARKSSDARANQGSRFDPDDRANPGSRFDPDARAGSNAGNRSFRVRFSRENTFEKVPKNVLEIAELAIVRNTGFRVDRFRPDHEFWFIIRRDGPGYFAQLLKKPPSAYRDVPAGKAARIAGATEAAGAARAAGVAGRAGGAGATEAAGSVRAAGVADAADVVNAGLYAGLSKGELRPELAYLLCMGCDFDKSSVVCDPYAGYGAIPLCIQRHFAYGRMYVNDSDAQLADRLRKTRLGADRGVVITNTDAAGLRHIESGGVDLIITDPPWGSFRRIDNIEAFYRSALAEMKRIIAPGGRIVLLTGKPAEMAAAAKRVKLRVTSRVNILVNGKKASVFTLTT